MQTLVAPADTPQAALQVADKHSTGKYKYAGATEESMSNVNPTSLITSANSLQHTYNCKI